MYNIFRIIIRIDKYLSSHARVTLDMWADLHVGHIKNSIFLPCSNQNWNGRQILIKLLNIKFYKNSVIILDFFICVQTDRHGEANKYIFTVLRWERATKPSYNS
jgi:hypothetical protein